MTVAQRISMIRLYEMMKEQEKYNSENVKKTEDGGYALYNNGTKVIEVSMKKVKG